MKASGLRERVLTALVLGALVVIVLLGLPATVAVGAILLVVLAGAWEWAALGGAQGPAQRAAYVAAVALALWLAWPSSADPAILRTMMIVAVAWWLLALAWLAMRPARGGRASALVCGLLVLVPLGVGLGRLVLTEPQGRYLLLFLIVLTAAADVGAFFGGRRFGRHKLAPLVSPGKTWEGFAAGMLAAALVAIASAGLWSAALPPWLAVCVLVAVVSVVGDLTESMFKRRAGLKDSGSLLPGHGGVLDRIDSMAAATPVYVLGLGALGFVP
jgi:phosphatidate cytidylyltransferase